MLAKGYSKVKTKSGDLPLIKSLLPIKGNIPALTRATTASVADFEGLLKTVKSGEVSLVGARRVENLISGSASLGVGANKTVTLTAGTYVFSMGAGSGVATFSGTGGASGTLAANATKRTSVLKTIASGTFIVTASVAALIDLQLENVTGQSNQNPGKYVSNGVIRKNNFVYSEQLDNSNWLKEGTSVVANQAVDSTGSINLEAVYETSANAQHRVAQAQTYPSGAVVSFQAELKGGLGRNWVLLWLVSTAKGAYFNLETGSVGTVTGCNASMTLLPNGAYLCKIENITTTGSGHSFATYIATGDGGGFITYLGDIAKGLYIGRLMSNYGATCLPYQIVTDASGADFGNYHGAGADGVEYFDTYNGNTVTNNVVTEATGAAIPAATLAGVQIEGASTNYFLNSGTPATHTSGTLTTGTYTLWLDGSGSIAVSAGTATITGAGTATSENQVTFTVTVPGTVTFTVTGTPTRGQCENNPMRTSYISTTTAPATRNVDNLTFQTTNDVSSRAGTLYLEATPKFNIPNSTTNGYGKHWLLDLGHGTGLYVESQTLKFTDGTNTATVSWIPLKDTTYKIAAVWGATGLKVILNGVESAISPFTGNMNVGLNASIGKQASVNTTVWGGCIKNRLVYKHKLSDTRLKRLTTGLS